MSWADASGNSQLCSLESSDSGVWRVTCRPLLVTAAKEAGFSRCLRLRNRHRCVEHTLGRTRHHVRSAGPSCGPQLSGAQEWLVSHGAPCTPLSGPRPQGPVPGAVPVRRCGLSEAGAPRPCRGTSQSRPHTAVTLSVAPPYCLGRTAAVRRGAPPVLTLPPGMKVMTGVPSPAHGPGAITRGSARAD